jgi:hypothetical protein
MSHSRFFFQICGTKKKLFSKSSSSNVHTKNRHFLITYGKSTPSGMTTETITLSVAIAAIGMPQNFFGRNWHPTKNYNEYMLLI